jgi:hypothetical protein
VDQELEVLGDVVVGQRRRVLGVDPVHDRHDRLVGLLDEGGLAGGDGAQHGAEGVDVAGGAGPCAAEHLGGGVGDGAGDDTGGGALGVAEAGDPEVGQLVVADPRRQDVGRLDVAVEDPGLVGGAERIAHLDGDPEDLLPRGRAVVGQLGLERARRQVLHGEEGQPLLGLAGVVHGDDVRVPRERPDRLALGLEPPLGVLVGRVDVGQHLEGDRAPQLGLVGPVHDREATPTQLALDLVPGDRHASLGEARSVTHLVTLPSVRAGCYAHLPPPSAVRGRGRAGCPTPPHDRCCQIEHAMSWCRRSS